MADYLPRRRPAQSQVAAACAVGLLINLVGSGLDGAAAQSEIPMSKEILAVEVRQQGFACTNPLQAIRDTEHSTPANAMWILRCDNAHYQVHSVPKMAAEVKPVE